MSIPNNGVHVRWMIRRDLPEILAIPTDPRWDEQDFLAFLAERNRIGMVAECVEKVVGFMCYALNKDTLYLAHFGVAVPMRRRGVGARLIAKLKSKLSENRRARITIEVPESNLLAHLFLKAQGFRAVQVLRDEEAYRFEFCLPGVEIHSEPLFCGVNRIAQYYKE